MLIQGMVCLRGIMYWVLIRFSKRKSMLADGRIVTVNAFQNSDLYRALRGGRPGCSVFLSFIVRPTLTSKQSLPRDLSLHPKQRIPLLYWMP